MDFFMNKYFNKQDQIINMIFSKTLDWKTITSQSTTLIKRDLTIPEIRAKS